MTSFKQFSLLNQYNVINMLSNIACREFISVLKKSFDNLNVFASILLKIIVTFNRFDIILAFPD